MRACACDTMHAHTGASAILRDVLALPVAQSLYIPARCDEAHDDGRENEREVRGRRGGGREEGGGRREEEEEEEEPGGRGIRAEEDEEDRGYGFRLRLFAAKIVLTRAVAHDQRLAASTLSGTTLECRAGRDRAAARG
eukprot:COSAG02_NODE_692_length_18432_cov_12.452681_9_plen_138_part_00